QALLRLLDARRGEIHFDGQPIHGLTRAEMRPLRSRMQIVFQDPFSSLNPRMTIGQIIEEGLAVNRIGATRRERVERVREALVSAGMPGDI
ncbi:MAG: ATP-binding cassette domain-containing protein, partial [Mesorhizobium sp.]